MQRELRDYRYVNLRLSSLLAKQIGLEVGVEITSELEIGANIKILSGKSKHSKKRDTLAADDPQVISMIVEALRNSGQLKVYRPEKPVDVTPGYYVFEEMLEATPIYVPLSTVAGTPLETPVTLTVWVSDPAPEYVEEPRREGPFKGSFLFLVQELTEITFPSSNPLGFSGISGLSALRLIVDFLVGRQELDLIWSGEQGTSRIDDPPIQPRWRFWKKTPYPHPLEKLASVGGVLGRPRKIESVYRIAYMTDEQYYPAEHGMLRVNDICAYPLYIAE